MKPLRIPVKLFKEAGTDDLSGAATELAYKLFLALFPFLIFLTALGGFSSSLFGIQERSSLFVRAGELPAERGAADASAAGRAGATVEG